MFKTATHFHLTFNIGQGEAMHRKYKRLKLAAARLTTVQSD
jgi:hypothetical protein